MITKYQIKTQEEKQQQLISLAEEIIDEYINTSACQFNKLIDFKLKKQCLEYLTSTETSLKNTNKLTPTSDADVIQKELSDNGNISKKTNEITEERYGNSAITAVNVEVPNHLETSDKEMGKKRETILPTPQMRGKVSKGTEKKKINHGGKDPVRIFIHEINPILWSDVVKGKNVVFSPTPNDSEEETAEYYVTQTQKCSCCHGK
ncbi:3361_t:CDS:1 [Paraglomus brasilianum]|uniref:3361_t:CDS:1 n=1 Tax=Paraglomus brasilianum TaxID=144538 RepID=A0A9N9DAB1_9GLOM|nr:3361_t:CDS:1 [Paraglomus brasilianum]